jgi:hypothetical protein
MDWRRNNADFGAYRIREDSPEMTRHLLGQRPPPRVRDPQARDLHN